MTHRIISTETMARVPLCLMSVLCLSASILAQTYEGAPSFTVHATAILGLESIPNNSTGELSIQADTLLFKSDDGRAARISVHSIQNVFLSQEDKQVGGIPIAMGRAATPYSGGRVIALLTHKKYDFITLEYRDANGGLHGVICRLNKGRAQALLDGLKMKDVDVRDRDSCSLARRGGTFRSRYTFLDGYFISEKGCLVAALSAFNADIVAAALFSVILFQSRA
jgi:hypothetical protein